VHTINTKMIIIYRHNDVTN